MESSFGGTPELEGTTLGHNSRDGRQPDPKTRARNRTSGGGGGGFLLDSIYRRNSPYGSSSTQRPQQHVPTHSGGDKRQRADDEIAVSKRRVVSNSDRDTEQEERQKGTSPRTSSLTAVTNAAASEGHESSQNESSNSRHASSRNSHSSKAGLDTDSLQIVNLALNLSESRKKAATSMRIPSSPLPGIPRLSTNNQRHFSHADSISRGLAGNNKALRASSFHAQGNKIPRNADSPTPTSIFDGGIIANHGVAGILPVADILDVDFVCSQATLGRIEKAKQHFELFSKYLELLSYLPPLQHPFIGARHAGGRKYNPLQSIRNRKLRLRDKNSNQTDTQGWQDIGRVEEWVASVAAAHQPESAKDPFLCASLPPFSGNREELPLENQSPWQTATSPGSSIRGLNRNGTSKVHRPRLDWVISPAELFADAVWVESGSNKSKIYDREGRKLYPDSSKLRRDRSSSSVDRAGSSQGNKLQSQEQAGLLPGFTERTSQARAGHGSVLFNEYNAQTRATNEGGYAPKWTRSSSISDESDSDDMRSRGRARRLGQKAKMKAEAALQAEKLHRVLHGRSESSTNAASRRSKSKSQPSSVKAGGDHGGGGGTQNLISPAGSLSGKGERGMSISEIDSTAPNSPAQGPIFPSITVNFSPSSSRSPSPQKRFPRIMETLQEKTKAHRHFRSEHGEEGGWGASFDESPSSSSQLRKRSPFDSGSSPLALAPSALPETALGQDEISLEDFRRNDTPGSFKPYSTAESRLKGFLKNSRIAEIVGNEVSKVGDRIRRKEGPGHSRHSSYASSIVSDPRDSDEERSEEGGDATPSKRNALRRGSTFSDDETGLPWRKSNNGRTSAKPFFLNLPSRGPSLRSGNHHNHYHGQRLNDQDRLQQPESSRVSDIHFISAHPDSVQPSSVDATPYSDRRRDSYGFGSFPAQNSRKSSTKAIIPQAALPDVERTRPPIPVTGLASVMASTKPQRQPSLTVTGDTSTINRDSHGWSLSDRSVPTIKDTNLMHKREILRCQALLLSSGVKASEIVYRYNQPRRRDRCSPPPPPRFLIKSLVDANAPVPANLSRIDEYDYAARNLLGRLDTIRTNLDKSIYLFSKSTLLPLQKEIDSLEDMIVNQLTPRVRSAAMDAETLNTQLNTTSTLEIKQLSDTLDQGLRKRNRRLRSIRRIGFSLLEWMLVGVMWWLWLIVMMFKMLRSIAKGIVGGVRWILWL